MICYAGVIFINEIFKEGYYIHYVLLYHLIAKTDPKMEVTKNQLEQMVWHPSCSLSGNHSVSLLL